MTLREYLDVDGVADALAVKPCFVRRLVWERRIPYYKVGKVRPVRPCRDRDLDRAEPTRTAALTTQRGQANSRAMRSPMLAAISASRRADASR